MSEPHAIHIETNEVNLPNQPFFSWLKSQTALLISQFLGLGSVLYVLAALIYYVKYLDASPKIFEPKNIQIFIIYAHIPFLLLFIVSLLNILDYNDRGSYRSGKVYERVFINKKLSDTQLNEGKIKLRKFKLYFLYFWVFMLVLYFSFIIQNNFKSAYELSNKLEIAAKINEANSSNNPSYNIAKLQEVSDLINEKRAKQIIDKFPKTGSQPDKRPQLIKAVGKIQDIDTSEEALRVIGRIEKINWEIPQVIGQILAIDNSEIMSETVDKFRETDNPKKLLTVLARILKINAETPQIVDKIIGINNSDEVLTAVNKIKEINRLRVQEIRN